MVLRYPRSAAQAGRPQKERSRHLQDTPCHRSRYASIVWHSRRPRRLGTSRRTTQLLCINIGCGVGHCSGRRSATSPTTAGRPTDANPTGGAIRSARSSPPASATSTSLCEPPHTMREEDGAERIEDRCSHGIFAQVLLTAKLPHAIAITSGCCDCKSCPHSRPNRSSSDLPRGMTRRYLAHSGSPVSGSIACPPRWPYQGCSPSPYS